MSNITPNTVTMSELVLGKTYRLVCYYGSQGKLLIFEGFTGGFAKFRSAMFKYNEFLSAGDMDGSSEDGTRLYAVEN